MGKNFRLYTPTPLTSEETVVLDENQTHYLKNVIKYSIGEYVNCFDNQNGEFLCQIIELNKKNAIIKPIEKIRDMILCPDLWLLFAPLKKDKTDIVIEKATELGCRQIVPVITQYTNTTHIKTDRYIAQSIEAAEQCRRTDLPQICPPQKLQDILHNWDKSRDLFFMDETLKSKTFFDLLKTTTTTKAAILVGPEGGFSAEELNLLRKEPFVHGATLGPRILRAETAAIAALSCWQMVVGDWRK